MRAKGRIGATALVACAVTAASLGWANGASAAWRTVEGETLRASGLVQTARFAVRLTAGGAEIPLVLRSTDRIAVRVKGRRCRTVPVLRILIDGTPVVSRRVKSRTWRRYEHKARITPGSHVVRVEMANAGGTKGCARSLTLDWIALRERILIGAAISWRNYTNDAPYREALTANFDGVTPENDMKFDALEPAPGVYAFDNSDAIVNLAERAHLAVHGHALVFDKQVPKWMTERQRWAPGEVRELLRSYIQTVVGRYRGRIESWDVVNEPMAPDGSLAPTFFARHLGEEYIELALRFAHEADPAAKLYINEFAADELSPRADGLLELTKRLKAKGAPLHGIGLQFHANIGKYAPRPDWVRPNLQRFADLGLELAVSEMDVRTSTAPGSLEERLRLQAGVYGNVARWCAEQPACVRFTTWGVTDRFSWLGPGEHGLPFDWAGRAKPAWSAITDVLR